MKPAIVLSAAATLGVAALGQTTTPQLLRTQTAFDLAVRLPYAETAPLFGPEGERAWAGKRWNPQFLYPPTPHDEQGAVFTVQHGPVTATWVNALLDLDARHLIYAHFIPGIMVTTIDVRFTPANPTTTKVHVVYTRTSLTPEGTNHVTTFTTTDKTAAQNWQQAINEYLASPNKQ